MPDESKAGDVAQTVRVHGSPMSLSRKQYYLRLAGAFLLGAAATGAAILLFKSLTSDEPPIRVRGGSMHLDLVCAGPEEWMPDTGNGVWFISGGENANEEYTIALDVRPATSTCQNVPAKAKVVEVTYSKGERLNLQHVNKRTKVNGPQGVVKGAARRLDYTEEGYIKRLEFRGGGQQGSCDFTDATGL